MSIDKDIERLLKRFSSSNAEQRKKDVVKVAKYFFKNVSSSKTGSHEIQIEDRVLREVGLIKYDIFTIPVKHGRYVKAKYCKLLAKTIMVLREEEEL